MNQGRSGLCGELRTNRWRRLGGVLCPSGLLRNERNGCLRSRLGDRWVARLPVIQVPCRANHVHGLLVCLVTPMHRLGMLGLFIKCMRFIRHNQEPAVVFLVPGTILHDVIIEPDRLSGQRVGVACN